MPSVLIEYQHSEMVYDVDRMAHNSEIEYH